MKNLTKTLLLLALSGLFTQSALAQDAAASAAMKQIADIVANINHFPSDAADKATLAEIAGNMSFPEGLRNMADTVANISHSATAEGKAAMAAIQANAQAPEAARELAGIIASVNHVASAEAKQTLATLFP